MRAEKIPSSLGIVPARFASSRFPGKPLAMIGEKPMVVRVYERASQSQLENILIATDDERILQAARQWKCPCTLTSPGHNSGTDRAAEVAAKGDALWIINIQGDEPFIDPSLINEVALALTTAAADLVTARRKVTDATRRANSNVVKVVTDLQGNALYFSRASIPYHRDLSAGDAYEHVGIYGYRREALLRLASLPPSPLEIAESLEQLRALENGMRIRVIDTQYESIAIDVPEDLHKAADYWQKAGHER